MCHAVVLAMDLEMCLCAYVCMGAIQISVDQAAGRCPACAANFAVTVHR